MSNTSIANSSTPVYRVTREQIICVCEFFAGEPYSIERTYIGGHGDVDVAGPRDEWSTARAYAVARDNLPGLYIGYWERAPHRLGDYDHCTTRAFAVLYAAIEMGLLRKGAPGPYLITRTGLEPVRRVSQVQAAIQVAERLPWYERPTAPANFDPDDLQGAA